MRRIRTGLFIVFGALFARGACANLNCDQLLAAAQTTISLRDQGYTLSQVLSEVESAQVRQKFNAQEVNLIRQIVRISFNSEFSLREIAEACQSGSLGIPKPKP